jgi:hypothetical protein
MHKISGLCSEWLGCMLLVNVQISDMHLSQHSRLLQGTNLDSKAKQWRLAADFMNDIGDNNSFV